MGEGGGSGMVSRTRKAHQYYFPRTDDANEDQRSAMGCLTTDYGMRQASGAKDRDMPGIFEDIPGERGGGVKWSSNPEKLICLIFHGRMTRVRINDRQWAV